jgi:hypothetical protein
MPQTPNVPQTMKPKNCSHWADQLQQLFPQTETPVTQEFMLAMGKLMANYSEAVLAEVCGPTGLVLQQNYLPSLFQLKQALDQASDLEFRKQTSGTLGREQREDRELEEKIKEDRKNRPTYDELMAGVPPSLRLRPNLPKMTAEEFLAKHPHVTREMLDACPDAPKARTELLSTSRYANLHPADRPSYTGPIEDIQPGDVIGWERQAEYQAFIKTKGVANPKIWGVDEPWVDSGARPFQISDKPIDQSNPFEE